MCRFLYFGGSNRVIFASDHYQINDYPYEFRDFKGHLSSNGFRSIASNTTVKLKSWRTNFLNITRGGQTLPIYTHQMSPMRTFSVLQKWPKIAKMTPNDLLTLEMIFTETLGRTEQSTLLVS